MSKPKLYPLQFEPIIKRKLWGGTKLSSILQKETDGLQNAGESWEISGVEDNISIVKNGPLNGRPLTELINEYKGALVGEYIYSKYGNHFPVLIKYIDANDDLSVQVHPDDELAGERHNSRGKTEMWYVLDAAPGATLITGFNRPLSRREYLDYFEQGRLMEILNVEQAAADDVFYLPAGRIHTIGKGLLIAEIQQTSDITYRIYDFDREDASGRKRELHTENALEAIDFTHHKEYKTRYNKNAEETILVHSPYFETRRLFFEGIKTLHYPDGDTCTILMCLEGELLLSCETGEFTLKKGDTWLIPAAVPQIILQSKSRCKLLETALR